jgi:hypothetical protein
MSIFLLSNFIVEVEASSDVDVMIEANPSLGYGLDPQFQKRVIIQELKSITPYV